MFATPVPAPRFPAEEIRSVLGVCQYAASAPEYASQLVSALAAATDSNCAIWLNSPMHSAEVVAQTEGAPLAVLVGLCGLGPVVANECHESSGIASFVAAPVMFRSSVAGVLAVANSRRRYSGADLELLVGVGRTAVLEYESRVQADAAGMTQMARRVAELAHDLRQPLSILEACACLLELALPSETRGREHLDEMHRQLDLAGGIIKDAVRGYTARVETSRFLANSAIPIVT